MRSSVVFIFQDTLDIATHASLKRTELMVECIKKDQDGISQWDSAGHWQGISRAHRRFNRELISLWNEAALCILVEAFQTVVFGLALVCVGLRATTWSAMTFGYVGSALLAIDFFTSRLAPMAKITSMCQNLDPGAVSIRKAADDYIDCNMKGDTLLGYIMFT